MTRATLFVDSRPKRKICQKKIFFHSFLMKNVGPEMPRRASRESGWWADFINSQDIDKYLNMA